MPTNYEIRGALSLRANFRHLHAQRLAQTLARPGEVYFATDEVTHSLVLRVRGSLTENEQNAVESTLARFSERWAATGAIFQRHRYGELSFLLLGFAAGTELLGELADLYQQQDALRTRQILVLKKLGAARESVTRATV